MALQLLHSEFLYIWGKLYFLFYQCMRIHHTVREVETKMKDSRPRKSPKLTVSASVCTFADCGSYTAKNQYRKGIARLHFQFPHSCVCERYIYSYDRSAYSAAGNNKSLKDIWMWELGLRPRNSQKINTSTGFSLQCRGSVVLGCVCDCVCVRVRASFFFCMHKVPILKGRAG